MEGFAVLRLYFPVPAARQLNGLFSLLFHRHFQDIHSPGSTALVISEPCSVISHSPVTQKEKKKKTQSEVCTKLAYSCTPTLTWLVRREL